MEKNNTNNTNNKRSHKESRDLVVCRIRSESQPVAGDYEIMEDEDKFILRDAFRVIYLRDQAGKTHIGMGYDPIFEDLQYDSHDLVQMMDLESNEEAFRVYEKALTERQALKSNISIHGPSNLHSLSKPLQGGTNK